jgi:hypothetical protein
MKFFWPATAKKFLTTKANEMHYFSDLFDEVLYMFSGFGGLVVWYPRSRVQTRPKLSDFSGEKILSTPSFGGKAKPSVPCRRFAAC